MPFLLYKPNKNNSGHGLGLQFNSKDQNLFLTIVKQTGFSEGGKGTFKGGKECRVALGAHEIGGILAVINGLKLPSYKTEKITLAPARHEQKYHHESEKQSCKISFSPYITKEGEVRGLSISIFQTIKESGEGTPFSFWAGIDEMFLLEEYLKFVLGHFNAADYSADKKKREEALKTPKKETAPKTKEEPAAQQEESEEEAW